MPEVPPQAGPAVPAPEAAAPAATAPAAPVAAAPAAPAPATPALAAPAASAQQQLVDELIFKRDVNEGFLLIDHISGRSEKSLKDFDTEKLEIPGRPPPATPGQTPPATPSQVWQKFCEIGYPPVPEPRIKAENAAFVLEVKDRLNALARPARGITIAYTAIFVGNTGFWVRSKATIEKQTLMRQAEDAYPSIAPHARRFAWIFGLFLPLFMLAWFLLTAATYWDVAYGGSIVQAIQHLDQQRTGLLEPSGQAATVTQAITSENCQAPIPQGPGAQDRQSACARLNRIDREIAGARKNLQEFYQAATGDQGWPAGASWLLWLRPIRWGFIAYDPKPNGDAPEWSVTWMLALFSTYVLPAMFGLLGTLAAIARAVLAKVRDSLLGPRDLSLSLLGLVIGPLAGLAVGLFFTPSGAVGQTAAGLAGSVTLTASGLGFLAGYGADAFFRFLDALLVRVFALEDGKGSK
jgi:hypothetical protein